MSWHVWFEVHQHKLIRDNLTDKTACIRISDATEDIDSRIQDDGVFIFNFLVYNIKYFDSGRVLVLPWELHTFYNWSFFLLLLLRASSRSIEHAHTCAVDKAIGFYLGIDQAQD
jgi:hypothetical protein